MVRRSGMRRGLAAAVVSGAVIAGAVAAPGAAAPSPDAGAAGEAGAAGDVITLDRDTYRDRLHAMWLGQTIANWTGLQTELTRNEPPFYTDADWPDIGFVTDQDPWLADDDTDVEYVYLHAASQAGTPSLTGTQIADAWQRHINDFIWVSNARARELMRGGTVPPATGLGMANPDSLAIDAQLTTEFFGAFAPGMPAEALRLADLPIRTTAEGHAYHASQFFALLYALAPLVDHLPPEEQPRALTDLARRYVPDTSKAADIVDFVLADFEANPDIDDWESTRDKIYQRYQLEAEANGFRYINAVESSINFAGGMMALLYGNGDYQRTVQIGTMSGWDSDNATATLGGLIGLLRGTEYIRAQFPDVELSDRYHAFRTRDRLPDHLPGDPAAEDTLTAMAERMIPLVERAIEDAGGSVDGGQWRVPTPSSPPDPADLDSLAEVSPGADLLRRSANHQVRAAGGAVEAFSSIPGAEVGGGSADIAVVADGAESDFTGAERFEPPRYFTAPGGGPVELGVTYSQPWTTDTVRIVTGPAGSADGLHDATVQVRTTSGRWVQPSRRSFATALISGDRPHQIVDVHLGRAERLTGVRIVGEVAAGDRLAVAEIDALAPARASATAVEGPLTATPRAVAALPGSTVEVEASLPGTGTAPWIGRVELDTPPGWRAEPDQAPVRRLKPGQTWTRTFAVAVPDTAEPASVLLDVRPDVIGVDLPAAAVRVVVMDDQVTDLTAGGLTGNAIELSWTGVDSDALARFRVYGSTDPEFELGPDTLVGETDELAFTHLGLGLDTTWYYRVVPVDGTGAEGTASPVASATSGSTYLIEAEQLLPPVEATKPAVRQTNCCGVEWSGGAQIWFQSNDGEPGDHLTLEFTVPESGTFDLVTVYTKANDFGIHQLSIDGQPVGEPFDAYAPNVQVAEVDHGPVQLDEGRHTVTLTVTGQNPDAVGLGLGIDTLELIPA
ncbi:ADP-ribosylglycohydrolase family protein [Jiangella asiatica]|uniref:Alpha-galactosidase NEW3 domain-containing protein n=1 Tax=Jiangella asiatica TaxID=2530372 RepID=A0A4R5D5A4_9ACTN|nr:ADP-ribosylglycohydrolase family protein [Jiangella asiatica]TDE08622.1 hypothetical protein E1269_17015 [Jiangella asiatica]